MNKGKDIGQVMQDASYNNMSKERAAAVIAALCGEEKPKRREGRR